MEGLRKAKREGHGLGRDEGEVWRVCRKIRSGVRGMEWLRGRWSGVVRGSYGGIMGVLEGAYKYLNEAKTPLYFKVLLFKIMSRYIYEIIRLTMVKIQQSLRRTVVLSSPAIKH